MVQVRVTYKPKKMATAIRHASSEKESVDEKKPSTAIVSIRFTSKALKQQVSTPRPKVNKKKSSAKKTSKESHAVPRSPRGLPVEHSNLSATAVPLNSFERTPYLLISPVAQSQPITPAERVMVSILPELKLDPIMEEVLERMTVEDIATGVTLTPRQKSTTRTITEHLAVIATTTDRSPSSMLLSATPTQHYLPPSLQLSRTVTPHTDEADSVSVSETVAARVYREYRQNVAQSSRVGAPFPVESVQRSTILLFDRSKPASHDSESAKKSDCCPIL